MIDAIQSTLIAIGLFIAAVVAGIFMLCFYVITAIISVFALIVALIIGVFTNGK